MQFDRLKIATLNRVKLYQSDDKEMPERSTEFDSDFEQVAPRTRNVPNRARAVDANAAEDLADVQNCERTGMRRRNTKQWPHLPLS